MKKKVYISGKMSGLSREEYMERFHKASMLLVAEGYCVVNPTRFLPCRWTWLYKIMGYRLTLLYDLWKLSRCDMIYKIPGWKESKGAMIEGAFAYHMKISVLPTKQIKRLDKKMVKFIEKRWRQQE